MPLLASCILWTITSRSRLRFLFQIAPSSANREQQWTRDTSKTLEILIPAPTCNLLRSRNSSFHLPGDLLSWPYYNSGAASVVLCEDHHYLIPACCWHLCFPEASLQLSYVTWIPSTLGPSFILLLSLPFSPPHQHSPDSEFLKTFYLRCPRPHHPSPWCVLFDSTHSSETTTLSPNTPSLWLITPCLGISDIRYPIWYPIICDYFKCLNDFFLPFICIITLLCPSGNTFLSLPLTTICSTHYQHHYSCWFNRYPDPPPNLCTGKAPSLCSSGTLRF